MRFWVFTGKSAAGPYAPGRLKGLPGFGPGTLVAPEGASSEEAWKPARDFPELRPLFVPAPAARAPKPSPARPAPRVLKPAHPHPAPSRAKAARPRTASALLRGRTAWVLAGLVCVLLLALVLHSVFERLGRSSAPAPSPAGPQRPMPFEAPGSPLLKTK